MLRLISISMREFSSLRVGLCLVAAVLNSSLASQEMSAQSPEVEARPATLSRLLSPIDENTLVTLRGNVRPDLTPIGILARWTMGCLFGSF